MPEPEETDFERMQREFNEIVQAEYVWDTYLKTLTTEAAAAQDRQWIANRAQEVRAAVPPQVDLGDEWVRAQVGSVHFVRNGSYMVPIGSSDERAQAVADVLNGPG